MSEYVVIRLAAEDQAVQWILADSNGTRLSNVSTGELSQAAMEVGNRSVIVLVPSIDLLTTTVLIPGRSNSKIKAALPFALEENLAEDVENLHFAVGERQPNGRLPVSVVANEKMDGWIKRLSDADIEPSIIAPDNHGLAKIPGTLSVLVNDDIVMFNDGADIDFVMQDIKPSDALVFAGQLGETQKDDEEKSGHLIVFCTAEREESLSHDWIALRQELHSVDVNILLPGKTTAEIPEATAYARTLVKDLGAAYPGVKIHLTGGVIMGNGFGEASRDDMTTLVHQGGYA